jgi:hypothetical protein
MDMTRKGIQESNFIFSKDCTGKFVAHKTRMPIIKCVCGFEILLVPDMKAMDRAIKNHVANHKKASDVSKRLTEQALIRAAN